VITKRLLGRKSTSYSSTTPGRSGGNHGHKGKKLYWKARVSLGDLGNNKKGDAFTKPAGNWGFEGKEGDCGVISSLRKAWEASLGHKGPSKVGQGACIRDVVEERGD